MMLCWLGCCRLHSSTEGGLCGTGVCHLARSRSPISDAD